MVTGVKMVTDFSRESHMLRNKTWKSENTHHSFFFILGNTYIKIMQLGKEKHKKRKDQTFHVPENQTGHIIS